MIRYSFIEEAEEELLEQILGLYRIAGWWPEEPDPPLAARMISGSHCFLTAKDGKHLVGMARAISDRANDVYIQDLTVHPDYRHQGIGACLVKTLLARLQADGLPWIGLIAERNSSSFYTPFGFEPMPKATPMLFRKP